MAKMGKEVCRFERATQTWKYQMDLAFEEVAIAVPMDLNYWILRALARA